MHYKIEVGQVLATFGILLGIALVSYLILMLARLAAAIKNVNSIIESNKENIDKTMNSLPGIVENVNEITGSVKRKTEALDNLFSVHSDDNEEDSSLISNLETIIASVSSVVDVFNEIRNFFGSKKKRIFKIKK